MTLTDHPTGLVRIIPYWLHLWVDRAVGVVFVIAPFAFKFVGLDAWYYWVLAAAVLLTTSFFNAPEESQSRRVRDWTRAQRVRHDGPTRSAPNLARNLSARNGVLHQRRLDRPSSSSAL